MKAASEGWIKPTDRYARSSRQQSHARCKRVWRSLIHEQAPAHRQLELDIVKAVFR